MCDELAEIALGWMGWSEEVALSTDVNAIIVAKEGRNGMLRAMFGTSVEEEPVVEEKAAMSPALFGAIFGGKPA
jgi:hypothetical protein